MADPDPILLQTLAAALLDRGVGRVLRVAAVDGVDQVLTDGIVGDLALIGLGFGSPAFRLITELRAAGWPRVITLAPTDRPRPAAGRGPSRCDRSAALPTGHPCAPPGPGPATRAVRP